MLFNTEVAMFKPHRSVSVARCFSYSVLLLALAALAAAPMSRAQSQPASPQTQQPDQTAPASGGPAGDTGVIAVPKKKEAPEEAPPPAPAAPKMIKNPEELGNVSPAIFLKRRHRVPDPVRAYFHGIVVQPVHARLHARLDEQRLVVEIAFAHLPQHRI